MTLTIIHDLIISHPQENHLNGNQEWKSTAVAYNLWERKQRSKLAQKDPEWNKNQFNNILGNLWKRLPESAKRPYFEEAEKKLRANEKKPALKGSEKFNGVDRVTRVKPVSPPDWMPNEELEIEVGADKGAESDPEYEPSKDEEVDNEEDHMIPDVEDHVKQSSDKWKTTSNGLSGPGSTTCVVCGISKSDGSIK